MKTPKIFTSLQKANEWANSQAFNDKFKIFKEDGFMGLSNNGIELIPAVHESYEDLIDEWLMIEQEKPKPKPKQEIKKERKKIEQAVRTYEGFDPECGF